MPTTKTRTSARRSSIAYAVRARAVSAGGRPFAHRVKRTTSEPADNECHDDPADGDRKGLHIPVVHCPIVRRRVESPSRRVTP